MKLYDQVNKQFQSILQSQDTLSQMQSLEKQMASFNMTMGGKPFPTFLKPYMLERREKSQFARATETIVAAIEKVAEAFFTNSSFESLLELDPKVAEFARIDHVYPHRQIVARLDAFYHPDSKDLKFIEFNCDSPSGMGWHDMMVDMFFGLPAIKSLEESFKLTADKFLDTHTNMMLKKYKEFCKVKGTKPVKSPLLAMVCANDSTVLTDVKIIVDVLKNKGHRSIYADPREFKYDGKVVTVNGEEVHLIYRDAIQEFLDEPYCKDTQQILQAYRDKAICFINPFSSRVGGLKSVLAIMSDKKFANLFNEEELTAIAKYIPWTRLVKDIKTDYNGTEINLPEFIKNGREKLVLKPNSGYGGKGVVVGFTATQKDWEDTLATALTPGKNYVVQELVPIPTDMFPVLKDGKLTGFEPRNVNINFWSYDGVFGGAYVRASTGVIINVHQGGGMVPVFYANRKTS